MGSKYNPDCVVDHSAMPKWSRSSESLVTMPDWVVTMPESVVTINRNTQLTVHGLSVDARRRDTAVGGLCRRPL